MAGNGSVGLGVYGTAPMELLMFNGFMHHLVLIPVCLLFSVFSHIIGLKNSARRIKMGCQSNRRRGK